MLEPRAPKAVGHPRQTETLTRDACARGLGADRRGVQGRGRGERPIGTSATTNAPGPDGACVEGIEVLDERDVGAGVGEVADGVGNRLFLEQLDGADELRR